MGGGDPTLRGLLVVELVVWTVWAIATRRDRVVWRDTSTARKLRGWRRIFNVFRAGWLSFLAMVAYVSVLWVTVAAFYPLTRDWRVLLATGVLGWFLWGIGSLYDRSRIWTERQEEKHQREKEAERKRRAKETAAEIAECQRIMTPVVGSAVLASGIAKAGSRGYRLSILFLNPAGELRETEFHEFQRGYVYHPQDRPKCQIAKVVWFNAQGQGTAEFSLGWGDGVPLWRIIKWGGDSIILQDAAGEQTSIFVEDVAVNDDVCAYHVLKFVNTFTSVADRTLRTIAEYGVPVLRRGRQAGRGSQEEGRLRIALQLGSGIFEPGKSLNWEELDGRDPDRS